MLKSDVKISIVTIVRNAPDELARTIRSILDQNNQPFEHLIIDGLSSDGRTVSVACEYQVQHPGHVIFISEKDSGISDALNKGIKLASGNYVICMNAGDEFYDSSSLEGITNYLCEQAGACVCYADAMIAYDGYDSLKADVKHLNLNSVRHFWNPLCHQAMAVSKELMVTFPFREDLKYSMDLDCWLSLMDAKCKFIYYNRILCRYHAGGISSNPQNIPALMREHLKVYRIHGRAYKLLPAGVEFLKFMLKMIFGRFLKGRIKKARISR